jgi:hypothetical protein
LDQRRVDDDCPSIDQYVHVRRGLERALVHQWERALKRTDIRPAGDDAPDSCGSHGGGDLCENDDLPPLEYGNLPVPDDDDLPPLEFVGH